MYTPLHRAMMMLCLLLVAPWGHAVDGVLEINQACAINTGCFSGDDPGFPVQIKEPGSYVLTGNLDVRVAASPADTSAVLVSNTSHVDIDLNGHSIRGLTDCDGTPVTSCSGTGSGSGVTHGGSSSNISVRNGFIRNMGRWGVFLPSHSSVIGVRVTENGLAGILIDGPGGTVRDSLAKRNGDRGLYLPDGFARVANNVTTGNKTKGITTGDAAVVIGNVTGNNGTDGITVSEGSIVKDNIAHGNTGYGIGLSNGESTAIDNVARDNGNQGLGCFITAGSYKGNTLINNGGGTVTGCDEIGINYCDGDTNCP